jgi:hypothetical protein
MCCCCPCIAACCSTRCCCRCAVARCLTDCYCSFGAAAIAAAINQQLTMTQQMTALPFARFGTKQHVVQRSHCVVVRKHACVCCYVPRCAALRCAPWHPNLNARIMVPAKACCVDHGQAGSVYCMAARVFLAACFGLHFFAWMSFAFSLSVCHLLEGACGCCCFFLAVLLRPGLCC